MNRKSLFLLIAFCSLSILRSQSLDISGYKIVQASASNTITLPVGTIIEAGGYVIVARNATKSSFETAWGITLASNVVFINGTTVVGSNGFPTINGSETYDLQNAGGVSIDGITVAEATSAGQSLARLSPIGAPNLEASWSRAAMSAATPGTGFVNTNSGKLIISEFSDASSYVNEFVELYYDVTPAAKGQGTAFLSPSRWKYSDPTGLQIVVAPGVDTLRAVRFQRPSTLQWNALNVSVQPAGTVTESGDTILVTNLAIGGTDSIIVSIAGVTAADTTDQVQFDIRTSTDGVTYLPMQIQPKMLIFGSPRPMNWVKQKDGGGNLLYTGKWVVVQGLVTAASDFGGPSYLQDETAGIAVYDSSVTNKVNRGDLVTVLGQVSPYNEMFELNPCTLLQTVSEGNPIDTAILSIPQVKAQPQKGIEPYECRLIRVNGISSVLTTGGSVASTWSVTGSGTNYELVSGTDTLEVRISARTNLAGTSIPAGRFDVVGVLGQYLTYYQILPRSADDLIVEGGGPRIISGAPYETNITSSTITLVWQTDLPGNSKAYFGASATYSDSVIDNALTTQHQVTVSGLNPATIYHVRLGTSDAIGTTYTQDYLVSTSSLSSTGTMNVYFNYPVNTTVSAGESGQTVIIVNKLLARINAATSSIDAALYSLSGTVGANVASALVTAKGKGVKVRVIGEADNSNTAPWTTLLDNGIPLIFDSFDATNAGAGLMHNKFVVIDNRNTISDTNDWIWTGSWNATDPGNNDDAQNVIEIQDRALANAYTAEFNEMWGSDSATPNSSTSRFGARKLDNTPHYFVVNNTPIELYFSPSDRTTPQIIKTLSKATDDINVALLTFTRTDIANVLIAKKKAGFKVRGVMNNRTDQGSVYDTLLAYGVDMHLKGGAVTGMLHHKYGLVDAQTLHGEQYVITGSHNWSGSAENSNNENTLIIDSRRIANLYLQEFVARYKEAGGSDSIALTVRKTDAPAPTSFGLSQNYPNPFNPTTNFELRIARFGFVSVKVFDLLGREVATLVDGARAPGVYTITWDASKLASGMYLCRMKAENFSLTKKILLVR